MRDWEVRIQSKHEQIPTLRWWSLAGLEPCVSIIDVAGHVDTLIAVLLDTTFILLVLVQGAVLGDPVVAVGLGVVAGHIYHIVGPHHLDPVGRSVGGSLCLQLLAGGEACVAGLADGGKQF